MSSALWGSVDSSNALINIIGESQSDQAGWAVAGSEDVDGDGIVDMWISAPATDGTSFDVGGAYLISGIETGTLRLAQATTTIYGDDSGGRAGEGMAAAGDASHHARGANRSACASTDQSGSLNLVPGW
jgi:hypothetical protein